MTVFVVGATTVMLLAGLALVVRGVAGSTIPFDTLVAQLSTPRQRNGASHRPHRLTHALAGARTRSIDADLAVRGVDVAQFGQQRLLWALLAMAPGLATVAITATGSTFVPLPIALIATVAGAPAGWWWARADLAADAAKARRAFRHAFAAYLDLVGIMLAGGAGTETALFDAVAIGRGDTFGHLHNALAVAAARREPPWQAFGELGRRLGIVDLEELEATMTIAGEGGASVRDSLRAKAAAIRLRDQADIEAAANARSETLIFPVVCMFAGFLLIVGYPALAALANT